MISFPFLSFLSLFLCFFCFFLLSLFFLFLPFLPISLPSFFFKTISLFFQTPFYAGSQLRTSCIQESSDRSKGRSSPLILTSAFRGNCLGIVKEVEREENNFGCRTENLGEARLIRGLLPFASVHQAGTTGSGFCWRGQIDFWILFVLHTYLLLIP